MDKSLLTMFALAGLTVLLLAAMLWDSMCEYPESRTELVASFDEEYRGLYELVMAEVAEVLEQKS